MRPKYLAGVALLLVVSAGAGIFAWKRRQVQVAVDIADEQHKYDYCDSPVSNWVCLGAGNRLEAFLASELIKAHKQSLRPLVYVGAVWCPPCQAFKRSLVEPEMRAALRGSYVIELSLDHWRSEDLARYGLDPKEVPTLFAVDSSGHASGPTLTGNAWSGSSASAIAGSVRRFLASLAS